MQNNTDSKLLQDTEKMISQCERCGTCLTVCPLYSIQDIERVSPRGKNMIARALSQGGIEPTAEVLHAVNFCLLCRSCVENCPSKIKVDQTMINVREYLTKRNGGPGLKYSVLGGMLKRRGMVKLAAGALSVVRKIGLSNLVPHGMAPDEYMKDHFLSASAGPGIYSQKKVSNKLEITNGMRVAYFQGCGMQMMFPEAVADTLRIIETTTLPVVKENVCCGLPHLAHGLRADFFTLAKKNIALYEDTEVVVTDCASCGGALKHLADYFEDDPQWKERAAAFSRKVMDLAEYLTKVGYSPQQKLDVTFTYHDPCHLGRGQGIKKQPRELLRAAGNYVEMEAADLCCGGAGTFHMDYPDVSSEILSKKQKNIEKTGAAVVVTGCPTCLVQLSKAAKASGGKFKAMHISQVI